MKDDVSEIITNAECYTINSATSIYAYKNNTRETYTQIGGKWKKAVKLLIVIFLMAFIVLVIVKLKI